MRLPIMPCRLPLVFARWMYLGSRRDMNVDPREPQLRRLPCQGPCAPFGERCSGRRIDHGLSDFFIPDEVDRLWGLADHCCGFSLHIPAAPCKPVRVALSKEPVSEALWQEAWAGSAADFSALLRVGPAF